MAVRLFSKVSVLFQLRDENGGVVAKHAVKAMSFDSAPDWVMQDPLMALCLRDKSIEIFNNKEQEKQLEMNGKIDDSLDFVETENVSEDESGEDESDDEEASEEVTSYRPRGRRK